MEHSPCALQDLDVERGLLLLREKGGTVRWQPISVGLATSLAQHAAIRGAVLPTEALLRYWNGSALTSRRYDHLWHRIGSHLPWVAAQGISMHWSRQKLTWVERHFGYGTARARHHAVWLIEGDRVSCLGATTA